MNSLKRIVFTIFMTVTISSVGIPQSYAEGREKGNQDDVIRGQYIIVLKDSVVNSDLTSDDVSRRHGLGLTQKYGHVIKGFSATIPLGKLEEVKNDPRVAFVSEDRMLYADARLSQSATQVSTQVVPTGVKRINAQANLNTGAGVGVAVIDTGIDLNHSDLKSNLSTNNKNCVAGARSATDDNGHGTHVAGIIAAANNNVGVVGVAPKAKLFAVKVLDRNGAGTWSNVICGIDWVTANAAKYGIKVANMSLGGAGTSDNNCGKDNNDALHAAICRARDAGVTFVTAAGNNGFNVDNVGVPASYDDAVITVSALADSDGLTGGLGSSTSAGLDDSFASFSNWGSVVDIAAPGVAIYSTYKNGSYATLSGTSMATPHVAGVVALSIQSHAGLPWTWLDVRSALMLAGEHITDASGNHSETVLQANSL